MEQTIYSSAEVFRSFLSDRQTKTSNKWCVEAKKSPTENNWAHIDLQNLHKGTLEQGWKINWTYFRHFLLETFNVKRAYIFLGYIPEYKGLYYRLRKARFELEFRNVRRLGDGSIDGGNIDADLASHVMDYKLNYDQAVIVADDADYCRTIQSLNRQNKLKAVISSHHLKNTSEIIKRVVDRNQIISIHSLKELIEQR